MYSQTGADISIILIQWPSELSIPCHILSALCASEHQYTLPVSVVGNQHSFSDFSFNFLVNDQ